ncbi:hypothetical protein ACWD33_15700 [Streptomyces xiamenensis]|uniref:Uncharacterized protein n=1 Tax=Streptomyces xiamenensis TaxID=408015 RepID=A0A0F7CPE0_9ACTN|nr:MULTISPECIES: hypothetical protein [Streptomyces]AKG44496.1 hypothetical protein SXIM_31120 [Streptomyces xiamenensis]
MGKHDKPKPEEQKPQGPSGTGDHQVPPDVFKPGGGTHKKDGGKK